MRRTLAGIVAGIAIAVVVMVGIEAVGNRLYPPPMWVDLERPDAAVRMPLRTLMFPVIGWFVGPLAGGITAVLISGYRRAAWIVAGVVLIGAVLQFALAVHPLWMIAAGIIAPLAGAGLAQLMAGRRAAGRRMARTASSGS